MLVNKFHRPTVKTCDVCKRDFVTSGPHQRFCSRHCFYKDQWTWHKEEKKQSTRRWKEDVKRKWGATGPLKENSEMVIESERYAAEVILPKEGYEQIILTRSFDRSFPVDVFGKKNGVWFGFDVSLCYYSKPRPEKTRLFEWLGIKTAVLFLKPDKAMYFIKEYDSTKTHLSCFKELRAALSG